MADIELMVEWCKSRARVRSWVQEVHLLDEEMDRVLRFNESMAKIWDARRYDAIVRSDSGVVGLRNTIATDACEPWDADSAWAEGIRAYACKQAWIRRQQATVWAEQCAAAKEEGRTFMAEHTMEGICTAPLIPVDMDEIKRKKRKKPRKKAT